MTCLRRFILMTNTYVGNKQPYHASMGPVRRRASMSAVTSSSAAMSCLHGACAMAGIYGCGNQ